VPFTFNPFTGNFDAVSDPIETPFTFSANCLSTDAVGHCVYITGDLVLGVIQVAKADITDKTKMPAVGVIVSKSAATDCIVVYLGAVDLAGVVPALSPGKMYFVGPDSKPNVVRPVGPALLQIVGVALDSSRVLFNPSPNMTKVL